MVPGTTMARTTTTTPGFQSFLTEKNFHAPGIKDVGGQAHHAKSSKENVVEEEPKATSLQSRPGSVLLASLLALPFVELVEQLRVVWRNFSFRVVPEFQCSLV